MKHYAKGLILGMALFLVCIVPAYGASIVTTNYKAITVTFAWVAPRQAANSFRLRVTCSAESPGSRRSIQ